MKQHTLVTELVAMTSVARACVIGHGSAWLGSVDFGSYTENPDFTTKRNTRRLRRRTS
jgi:hypothetical protein